MAPCGFRLVNIEYSMFALLAQRRILEDRKVKSYNLTSLRSSGTSGILVKNGKTQLWHVLCEKLTNFPKHVPLMQKKICFITSGQMFYRRVSQQLDLPCFYHLQWVKEEKLVLGTEKERQRGKEVIVTNVENRIQSLKLIKLLSPTLLTPNQSVWCPSCYTGPPINANLSHGTILVCAGYVTVCYNTRSGCHKLSLADRNFHS